MKSIGMYVIVFTISMLFVFQLAIIAVILAPEIYAPFADIENVEKSIGESETIKPKSADLINTLFINDSLQTQIVWEDSLAVRETKIIALQDSIRSIYNELKKEQQRINGLLVELETTRTQLNDRASREMQTLVKTIEAMSPEDAVRILQTTTDKEVREALLMVNRRQAARIMSLLEPDRAARIMKFTVEGSD